MNSILKIVNFIGPPGNGKTKQSDLLMHGKRYRSSYSDQLRPFLGLDAKAKLIPDSVIFPILLNELMYQLSEGSSRVVLPGLIKNETQAEMLQKSLVTLEGSRKVMNTVVCFEASDEILLDRLRNRSSQVRSYSS